MLAAASAARSENAVHAHFGRISHPQFTAEGLDVELLPAFGERAATLRLRAERLRIDSLDRALREVAFDCEPRPIPAQSSVSPSPQSADASSPTGQAERDEPGTWQCEGPLSWRGGTGWRLAWQADEALSHADVRLIHGRSELRLTLPLDDAALAVDARRLPVAWLQAWLPQLQWQQGRIDGRIQLTDAQAASRWRGEVRVNELSAEAADGLIAMAGMTLSGPVELRSRDGGRWDITTSPTLSAGELLAGSVYVAWPAGSAVALDIAATREGESWRFDRLKLDDAGFRIEGQATVRPRADAWLERLSARFDIDLASRYERYLEGAMASLGQSGLQAAGSISGSIDLGAGGRVEAVDARLDDVTLRHPENRYALSGLAGDLAFRRGERPPAPIDLRWRALSVHALAFDAGNLKAITHAGEIRASEALRLGLFGGSVIATDLIYRPLTTTADRLQASVELAGIDIAKLVAAFDWPAFSGRLDGRLPRLRYADDTLSVGGEIDVQVFGGEVRIADLAIERPFGVAPALAGEVTLDDLDLQPMTEVFGLGRIEGRLNGRIDNLRLLDWRPTAFDASLYTAEKGRRRISQLAVDQLTQIGGGGGAGGLQGRLLGVFDSFGYRKIGLSCRLANNVCEMGGIEESSGGYTILQGSGLPLITIRGFQTRVDWPVLVERLQSVASGQSPVIE